MARDFLLLPPSVASRASGLRYLNFRSFCCCYYYSCCCCYCHCCCLLPLTRNPGRRESRAISRLALFFFLDRLSLTSPAFHSARFLPHLAPFLHCTAFFTTLSQKAVLDPRSLRDNAKANSVSVAFQLFGSTARAKRKRKSRERDRNARKNAPADATEEIKHFGRWGIIFVPSATVFRGDNASWVPQSRMQPTQKTRLGLLYRDSLLSLLACLSLRFWIRTSAYLRLLGSPRGCEGRE